MIGYRSTRSVDGDLSLEDVIQAGLARDGGLYVPKSLPQLDMDEIAAKVPSGYGAVAETVLRGFFAGTSLEARLPALTAETYGPSVFRHGDVAPIVPAGDNRWIMELFHGPTLAFKDFALQFLGRLFDELTDPAGPPLTILGATSGDTGSAAIEACRGRDKVRIVMLHPKGRVSNVQRRQMTTILEDNVLNIAVEGTFDDCQAMVKSAFGDLAFRDAVRLTAVNSINWARIVAQIVYYVWAVAQPDFAGKRVGFSVPTGNFGDIYAGYLARAMGAPLGPLMIATNANDILVRTLETGDYRKDAAKASISPSMDIQIASNFERLLLDAYGGDAVQVAAQLKALNENGGFTLEGAALQFVRDNFVGARADDAATLAKIRDVYAATGYIADPHTATGLVAADQMEADIPVITLATAHPAKFPDAVVDGCGQHPSLPDHMADLFDREERFEALPVDMDALKAVIGRF